MRCPGMISSGSWGSPSARASETSGSASSFSSRGSTARGLSPRLYRDLYELTERWKPERRRDLLVRYLGFPFWDVLLYPVQALGTVGEQDFVEIVRIRPRDAQRIPVPKVKGQRGKLKG